MNQMFGSIGVPVLDQLQLSTLAAYGPKINTATLDRESALWGMLKAQSMTEEGWEIELKNRINRANVGANRGPSPINTQRHELFAGSRVEWKEYYGAVTIDKRTLVQNCNLTPAALSRMRSWNGIRSDTRTKLIDLLGKEMMATLEDLTDRLSEDLYASGRPRRGEPDILEGIGKIIEPNTPYAGTAHSKFRKFKRKGKLSGVRDWIWNPKFKDFGNKSARINDYYSAFHDMHRGRRGGEIWVVMPANHYDNLSLQLEGQKTRNRQAEELGFDDHIKAINYNATFFPDDYCQGPDGSENVVYGFRPRNMKLLIHSGDNMTFHPGVIPDDQFSIIFRISITLALICDDRARTFKFSNVTP